MPPLNECITVVCLVPKLSRKLLKFSNCELSYPVGIYISSWGSYPRCSTTIKSLSSGMTQCGKRCHRESSRAPRIQFTPKEAN